MTVSCPDCRSVFRVDPAKVPATGVRARCSVCGGIIVVSGGSGAVGTPARTPARAVPVTRAPATLERPSERPGRLTPPFTPSFDTSAGAASRPVRLSEPVPRPAGPTPVGSSAPAPAMPGRGTPFGGTPARGTPIAGAPIAGAPISGTPAGGRPIMGTPTMGTPTVGTPTVGTPTVGTPSLHVPSSRAPSAPSPSPSTVSPTAPVGAAVPTPRRSINPFLNADPGQRARRLARALVSDLVAYHPRKRDEGVAQGTLRQLFRDEIKKSYEEYVDQVGREIAESSPHFQEALNDILAGGQRVF